MERRIILMSLVAFIMGGLSGTAWGQTSGPREEGLRGKAVLVQTCDSDYRLSDTLITIDQLPLEAELSQRIEALIAKDYLEASIDSIVVGDISPDIQQLAVDDPPSSDEPISVYIHVGPRYNYEQLSLDSISVDLLDRLDIKSPASTQEYLFARARLADYYADNGYPFAKVRLHNLTIDEGDVAGELDVSEGRKVIMDSIIVKGDVKLRNSYLKNYLDIYPGDPYDHSKIKAVQRKIDRLTFMSMTQPSELSFINNYASLNLYTEAKNTSRFDLIFGVIPTNAIMGRQLFLSLDFTTELLNKLGYGEYIFFDFERLRPEQQRIELKFNYPYLLDTPFAIDLQLSIFRNALKFQTVNVDLGVQYFINNTDRIKVAYNSESSKLIQVDTIALLSSGQLPDELSVSHVGLAVEADIARLDYRNNPRRGYALNAKVVLGQKKILVDPSIVSLSNEDVDFNALYEALDLVAPRYQATLATSVFRPVARRGALGFHTRSGWRYSPAALYQNEKFQIGGNKLLRGFDEASIFTSYYAISTLEYRLLLSENSYFTMPFFDIGVVEEIAQVGGESVGQMALVMGLGGGMVIETKVGMFNFSVAVGKGSGQRFDFRRPKAHFGFISLF